MNWSSIWSLYTLLFVVLFVAIVVWAYSGKRKKAFEEAANLPFADEPTDKNKGPIGAKETHHE